jgi:hypothetical protein
MRMTASWLGPEVALPNTSLLRQKMHKWRAPLGSSTDRHRQTPKLMQKAPVAVHHRSACSGVKALRNPSAAKRQAAKSWLAFRSLDPFRALREPDRRRRDEERPFRSEQGTGNKPKNHLTEKLPYKSCKPSVPQRRSEDRREAVADRGKIRSTGQGGIEWRPVNGPTCPLGTAGRAGRLRFGEEADANEADPFRLTLYAAACLELAYHRSLLLA